MLSSLCRLGGGGLVAGIGVVLADMIDIQLLESVCSRFVSSMIECEGMENEYRIRKK